MLSRHILTEWNASTALFIKRMQNCEDPRLIQLFQPCLPNKPSTLFTYPFQKELLHCQRVLNLECALADALPLAIFRKVLKGKPLNSIEVKNLDNWIKKINKQLIPVKTVHEAILSFAALNQKNEEKILDPIHLEMFLEDRVCHCFQQADRKTQLWQQQLKKGAKITLYDSEFVLSSEILSQNPQNDHFRVFTLEQPLDKVIIIAHNPALLRIRSQRQMEKSVCGIEQAAFESISPDGKCALMERLQPVNSYAWKSDNQTIHPDDRNFINEIGRLLATFVEENFTPSNFNHQQILFNNQWQLKSVKPMIKNRFDFDGIEDFIFHLSAGRLSIFQELMHLSKLSLHPIAKFYNDAVIHTLNGDAIALDDLAGIYKISHSKVVDRAIELTKKLQEGMLQLYLKKREVEPDLQLASAQKNIRKLVLDQYKASQAAGILWTSFY
jgi:hypothetical protein